MDRLSELKELLGTLESVVLAFSGGVDSTLLAKLLRDVLPREQLLAVTAESAVRPVLERQEAAELAELFDLPHIFVGSGELHQPEFVVNGPDRCYYCKKGLFNRLRAIAEERDFAYVVDGANADDQKEYRPGSRAAVELGVRSPLAEIGMDKQEVRALSQKLGLPTWNRPSNSCLATRFPYGTRLTAASLHRVEEGEMLLRRLGLRQVRLRDHGSIARLEVDRDELEKAFSHRDVIVTGLKSAGYAYITLDLEGYRTGSLDLELEKVRSAAFPGGMTTT